MALTLKSELQAARTELEKDSLPVVIRATLPPGTELPASGEHIVLDVVPAAPANDFTSTIYEDLVLQVGVWSDASLTSALAAAEAARGRMAAIDYKRTAGTQIIRDENYVGVVLTFTLDAAFNDIQ